ncbi:plasmid replication protein RepH [Halorubrum ezzemoulense]|uniref:Plasmid replication protein RepH n=1 Tax=Halorubrum ezzemoulense TaxID=337243 RepID=A0ABT4Z4H7_HALEZ|nr:plasmid replication protein RepH [Halorubrum ezzemoulense]MDB2245718.1 plasmid replication protein RepH [Halorubrum ezzemoulense]MDB2279365.1 plasmid replication protein RepH [Halorubrum ezzemoulense]MDB2289865.1 plasmid replication protein RepH [Halorubrum ezzemoulense]MDB2292949.1 plasmid replication protein RepH [Halorubrum ezzemoulense]MDB2297335.1 plasmid replication protein RepH [Halorubrum ezzemoulense]
MGTRQPAARKRGVRLVSHSTDISTEGISCPAVSPRLTEWVPELLAKLQPYTEQTIREHATTDPWRTSSRLLAKILPAWHHTDDPWTDDVAEAVAYTRAITTLALTYRDEPTNTLSPYHQRRYTNLTDTVTSIGTGRGPVNADLGALAKGPVALHRELDAHPTVLTLLLDGDAWTSLTDRRTGVRALAAIAVLADGFDVRLVASPRVRRHLSKRYPNWTECHLDLTASRDRSPYTDHAQTAAAAWEAIRDLDTEPGKRRLLGNLNHEYTRSYRDLATDHAVDVADGTISRYVLDLEDRELVTIDRRGQHNTVQLTELGERAVQQCLDDTDDLIHPDQRRLDGHLTATPQESTSTVSPRRAGGEIPTPDEWVAATGDPDADADYVQWLNTAENAPSNLHERFSTVSHDDAITLVDDQLHSFDDGRVAYLSHTNDDTHVVLQWGGPLATLGRLAGALLSEKALSKIFTPSRLGHEFEAIDDTQAYPVERILRRGHQVGWYSDAETTYEAWRERITTVRDRLLTRLAQLTDSDDTAARRDLFKDLHGVIASATQLYHAAGIDLTTTLRVPDTDALARNTTHLQDLCEFLAKTAPKQSVYDIHSGYRMLFEDRPAKLCRRLPAETAHNATMDLTMSWVVAGPTITELHDEITGTLATELTTVREAIADGTEAAPTLEIPVVDGTTYPAIRRVIDEVAMTHDAQWTPRERQRLVRRCLRSFGPADTSSACPYDVVVSFLRALNESPTPTLAAVERAAATLPPERFRPDLTPTATKLYATLLRADGPLGRSELIEQAGISASSYDRRLSDVRDLDRVTPVQQGGHRRWTTTNLTPPPKTPPVTAWLPASSDRPAPLVTHRQLTTPAGPNSPPPDRIGGDDRGGWDRQPPISIPAEPGCDAEYTTRPMTTTNQSRQPNSHAHQLADTRDHPHDTMTPTPHPTTAVATPQTQLPNGGDQQ